MKRVLYLGTHPHHYSTEGEVLSYPIIRLVPRPIPQHILDDIPLYTHVVFTSKNGVTLFFEALNEKANLANKTLIALGQSTAERLKAHGYKATFIADEESQEGIISLLRPMDLDEAYILLPHSSLARKKLEHFFQDREIRYQVCELYDTLTQKTEPVPDLGSIDEIVFTSPSTVRAFMEIFAHFPKDKTLTCIGPITQAELIKHTGASYDI